jgi:hypothetical protein
MCYAPKPYLTFIVGKVDQCKPVQAQNNCTGAACTTEQALMQMKQSY